MRQLLLPIPFVCLVLSGCTRQPETHALTVSPVSHDYHQRSDSALALLDSMASHPKTVYVKTIQTVTRVSRVAVPRVQRETIYVREEDFPIVSAMVRPMPAPVYVRDTVVVEHDRPVERVTVESPKRGWSLFTIKRVVDTVTVYVRDTVFIVK